MYIYIYIYVYIYVYMYIYICIYIYMYVTCYIYQSLVNTHQLLFTRFPALLAKRYLSLPTT